MTAIRIVIADDHPVFRRGLRRALDAFHQVHITAIAAATVERADPTRCVVYAAKPPSTVTTLPVMYAARSLTTNTAQLAISSGLPSRPRGIFCATIA